MVGGPRGDAGVQGGVQDAVLHVRWAHAGACCDSEEGSGVTFGGRGLGEQDLAAAGERCDEQPCAVCGAGFALCNRQPADRLLTLTNASSRGNCLSRNGSVRLHRDGSGTAGGTALREAALGQPAPVPQLGHLAAPLHLLCSAGRCWGMAGKMHQSCREVTASKCLLGPRCGSSRGSCLWGLWAPVYSCSLPRSHPTPQLTR